MDSLETLHSTAKKLYAARQELSNMLERGLQRAGRMQMLFDKTFEPNASAEEKQSAQAEYTQLQSEDFSFRQDVEKCRQEAHYALQDHVDSIYRWCENEG